jgi:hypothetical protein
MNISESDWNVFLGHAAATLAKFKVPESEQRDMDTLYNLEHGKYASLDAGMIFEILINLSSFASPGILIPYFWRNRRWFGT